MFNKSALLVSQWGSQQVRGMATLKQISMRLKSVKNMQKITQSMKMVSAAKYARAERDLKGARPYGEGASTFYEKAEVAANPEKPNRLIIAMSSDRGLCGGIHSNVCRYIRTKCADDSVNTALICIGDKARTILQKQFSKQILFHMTEVGRKPATFGDAGIIAAAILNCGFEFGSAELVYNRFKTVVSYETKSLPLFTMDDIQAAEKISAYDSLDADVIQSYMEFSLAAQVFFCLKEGACSEQSARMSAMDSASKNAGEMIEKLTLTFNRTRQAVITGELIEIISGAAAL